LLHCPGRRPTERFRIAKEKENRLWQQPEIANEHAAEKKRETDKDRRKQETFFHRRERGQNKFGQKIKEQRERENDPGIKCEVKRNHDRVRDAQGFKRADLRTDFVQRRLHHPDKSGSKAKANHHGEDERDHHFDHGPPQVLQVLEKRLRGFALGKLAKFKNVSQRHGMNNQSARASREMKPRAANRAQIPSVFASRISFSAIIRRISKTLNSRQSRIDSVSSWASPCAQ